MVAVSGPKSPQKFGFSVMENVKFSSAKFRNTGKVIPFVYGGGTYVVKNTK